MKKAGLILGVIVMAVLGYGFSPMAGTAEANEHDEYDALRLKWEERLTGGSLIDLSDPDIVSRIESMDAVANAHWSTMNEEKLWGDLLDPADPSLLTDHYNRLRSMTLAWATQGSNLANNDALKEDIIASLDWMYENRYNEGSEIYGNWFHWEIGVPLALNDIVVMLYDELEQEQIKNYMAPVGKFNADPTRNYFNGAVTYASNRINKSFIVGIRGILLKDGERIQAATRAIEPVLAYANVGEGFYTDGSYLQHRIHPYNGGYGRSTLSNVGQMFYLFDGTSWEITSPDRKNVFEWVYNGFAPFLYKGTLLEEVRGREISRPGTDNHVVGHHVIQSIIELSEMDTPHAVPFKSMVKYWLQEDIYVSFYANRDLYLIAKAKSIMNDPSIVPMSEPIMYKQYYNMDRVVQHRPGYLFSVSMSSMRIANYESINNENLRGWYTGDGATYLYTGALNEYSDNYWPTVDPYRLAGTTVDTQARADGSGQSYLSSSDWAGGVSFNDLYGLSGMELDAWNSSLTARKSWFMFDDEIVALGSGITSSDHRTIETIIENRKLSASGDEALTIAKHTPRENRGQNCAHQGCLDKGDQGIVQKQTELGWEETVEDVHWVHLEGTGGYYFPEPMNLNGKRESRTGSWYDINWNQPATLITRNYLTLWKDHGANPSNDTYSYVILPNQSKNETNKYADSPDITVLENSPEASAVKENTLQLTGVAFWQDQLKTVDAITSDRKAAVMMREAPGSELELSVSDPTQQNNGKIMIEIAKEATAVLSQDEQIQVIRLKPSIKLYVNVKGSKGRTYHVKFSMDPNAPMDTTPPGGVSDLGVDFVSTDMAVLHWTAPGDDGLDGKASTYELRYAKAPITEENWSEATPADTEINARTAGTQERYTVTGLEPSTVYYFAVKTKDELPNVSELSNVVSASTKDAPLFADDFDDGQAEGWSVVSGGWKAENGAYVQPNMGAFGLRTNISELTVQDAIIEAKLRIINDGGTPSRWAGIHFRKTEPSHSYTHSGYMIYLTNRGTLYVFKAGSGNIATYNTGVTPSEFVSIKVVAVGPNIDVYFNNSEAPVLSLVDSTYLEGHVSLITGRTHTAFDDIIVR